MKHAGPSTLHDLADLLAAIRRVPGLVEKETGIFYTRAGAYLHFHDDPNGVFADVKLGFSGAGAGAGAGGARGRRFERFAVDTDDCRRALMQRIIADRS